MVKSDSGKQNWFNKSKFPLEYYILGIFILVFSVLYFSKLQSVPFHPDESTQIFMSGDLENFNKDPSSLIWRADITLDNRMKYRLLDAPFAREWIGVFRLISGKSPLLSDWDWTLTWQENENAGAMPSIGLLSTSRLASSIFFPLDLIFLFFIGRKIRGNQLGWLIVFLFSFNALVLLHTRRAMSEGPLIFFIILALWAFLQNPKYLILSAIPVALAFNSKYSALPLFLVGVFTIVIRNWRSIKDLKRILLQTLAYILVFLFITVFLNPFLWFHPLQALLNAFQTRQELITRQVYELGQLNPGIILNSPLKRILAMVGNLFITPLAFSEVGNYIQNTSSSEIIYLHNSIQNLFRGFIGGGIYLLLTILGFIFGLIGIHMEPRERNHFQLILVVGTILQAIFLLFTFPFPFQRYVMPLVPFTVIWAALAMNEIINTLIRKTKWAA
jgi:4-amino-4-deoxy-L-arabinose transferase-like glycosyltransferase